ncbi:YlbF family regulator [Lactococcus cremoris]|uniref:YlbF family regulator n=1 Tax=Lactococcus lactis subsp. cremoris TaxID=1359 RepID=UPI002FC8FF5F
MLIIDENLVEIDDLLEKIMDSFLEFPEIKLYQKAKADFMADETLQNQLKVLNDNSDYISFRPELKTLQYEINTNEKVYALRLAENDVQQILTDLTKKITKSISEQIYVDENLPLKGGQHGRHHGKH